MRKLTLLLSLCMLTIASCSKDDTSTTKQTASQGTIRFTNSSSNPYSIYINGGSQGSLSGKSFREIKKAPGNYTLKAVQQSGYLVYPTIAEVDIYLSSGEDREFLFP